MLLIESRCVLWNDGWYMFVLWTMRCSELKVVNVRSIPQNSDTSNRMGKGKEDMCREGSYSRSGSSGWWWTGVVAMVYIYIYVKLFKMRENEHKMQMIKEDPA